LVVLLAIPEFLYLGLVYMPTLLAISMILASHLVVRRHYHVSDSAKWSGIGAVFCSVVLFGLGVSFRWDVAVYGFVIVTDLALKISKPGRRWAFTFLWGTLALISAFTGISLSGYGLNDFVREVVSIQPGGDSISWFAVVGGYQTLFTPVLLILTISGFISLVRRKFTLAIIVAVGVCSASPMLLSGVPKWIITGLPAIVLCAVVGLRELRSVKLLERTITVTFSVLLIAPWVIGVKVYSNGTSWGPGFETASYTDVSSTKGLVQEDIGGRKVSIKGFALALGSGMAIPTPEGPRALGGHAAVLLGGGWRSLVNRLDQERREVITKALSDKQPILQDSRNAQLVILLTQMGFKTTDGKTRTIGEGIGERRFSNDTGEKQSLVYLNGRSSLYNRGQIEDLISLTGSATFVLYSSYSSSIRKIMGSAPGAVKPLGPFSAIVDARQLSQITQHVATNRISP
ncbi:MAG TPA: hypothetical protein VJ180_02735, partial [Pyrinomonadaceae bacterium]|nr:hypothetical protein [Pyrinomonadaceae bacterium]